MRISDWSSDVCSSDLAIDALKTQMKEFLGSKGVTAAELERTGNGSTRELPGSFETSGDVLTEMQRDVLYERPFDYVEGLADKYRALTAKDLDSAARAAIDPDAFTWVVVGDKNKVMGQKSEEHTS